MGTPIIALRYITEGVCNGTRLIVTKLMKNSIRAKVLNGAHCGKEVAITKINLTHDMDTFNVVRNQLPIRVAFAMTINKSQGLTLKNVGVYLKSPVFSHGQLYVALSRCGSPFGLKVYIPGQQPDDQGRWYTANIVYKEVLIDV